MGLDDDKTYIRALEKVFSIYEVIIRRNYDIELRKSLTFLLSRNRNLVSEFWVEEFFSGEKDVDRRKEILKDLCLDIKRAGVKSITAFKRRVLIGFFYKRYEKSYRMTGEEYTRELISSGLGSLEAELDFIAELEAKALDSEGDMDRLHEHHLSLLKYIEHNIELEISNRQFIDGT